MPVREKFCWPNDCAVSIDGTLIEADARQEALQGRVAVPIDELAIEAPAGFVDDVVAKGMHVRTGEGAGSPFLLSQAESRKRRSNSRTTAAECLGVVHPINMIFVREIVVDAKGSQIPCRIAWHQSLE